MMRMINKTSKYISFQNTYQSKAKSESPSVSFIDHNESRNATHASKLQLNKTNNYNTTVDWVKPDVIESLNQTTIVPSLQDKKQAKLTFGLK